ncbi:MAG: hypothetical protein LBO78_02350 [Rickettsiales bacterium]|nr:hypothetical protein [Rickettsiales bacterium]
MLSLPAPAQNAKKARAGRLLQNVNTKDAVGLIIPGNTVKYAKPGDPTMRDGQKCTWLQKWDAASSSCKCIRDTQKESDTDANGCVCKDPNYVVASTGECGLNPPSAASATRKSCGAVLISAIEGACRLSFNNSGLSTAETNVKTAACNAKAYGIPAQFKCYDPADMLVKIDTSLWHVCSEGKDIGSYDAICSNYHEEFLKSIAPDYATEGSNSYPCRRQRAIITAAGECYGLVLTSGRALGAVENLRQELNSLCGQAGIVRTYQAMFSNDTPGKTDVNFSDFLAVDTALPKDIPNKFIDAGRATFATDSVKIIGNILDGRLTDKTDTWERDLAQVMNTYLAQASLFCGTEYATQQLATDFQLLDTRSSLERRRDDMGLAAGATDWGMQQVSVFVGENRINKTKREGFFGGVKDEDATGPDADKLEFTIRGPYHVTKLDTEHINPIVKEYFSTDGLINEGFKNRNDISTGETRTFAEAWKDGRNGALLVVAPGEYTIIEFDDIDGKPQYRSIRYDQDKHKMRANALQAIVNHEEKPDAISAWAPVQQN